MAIANEWRDPDNLEFEVGDNLYVRAPDLNGMLGNLKWLHSRPRLTVARNTPFTVEPLRDTDVPYNEILHRTGGTWGDPEACNIIVPQDGRYEMEIRQLWPDHFSDPELDNGTFRRFTFLRDGDVIGGQRSAVTRFAEFMTGTKVSCQQGRRLSVKLRHDAGDDLDITPEFTPAWRSPLLFIWWHSPLDSEE